VIGRVAVVVLSVVIGLHVLAGVWTRHEDDLAMIGSVVVRLPVSNRAWHDTSVTGAVVLSCRRSATEKKHNYLEFSEVFSSNIFTKGGEFVFAIPI